METFTLYTIGYEGAARDDFWATLRSSGIKTLIDVRDLPLSRKPGFSKKALELDADSFGIGYIHLAGLGDPKEGRDAARAGQYALFKKIFSAHMESLEALSDLAEAVILSLKAPSCLLCYERNPENCHRSIIASDMMKQEKFSLCNLGVRAGLGSKISRIKASYDNGYLVIGGI